MLRKVFYALASLTILAAGAFHAWSIQAWRVFEEVGGTAGDSLALFHRQLPLVILIWVVGFAAYLSSFDGTRRRRPWEFLVVGALLIGSATGMLLRVALGAYEFILEEVPVFDLYAWLSMGGCAGVPLVGLIGFEMINRAIWPRAAAYFDKQESPGLALACNRMALIFKPGQRGMLRSVALARFRKGVRGEVVATIKALYDSGIKDADVLEALCKNASEQNESEEYLRYLRELHKMVPGDEDIREFLVEELIAQGQNAEALELMDTESASRSAEAMERYAKVLLAEGYVERATEAAKELGQLEGIPFRASQALLREVLSRVTDYVPALNILAGQAERMAQREQRLRWLEKSYKANPHQENVRETLLAIYRESGQTKAFEELLAQKYREYPNDHKVALEYAAALYNNGKHDEALTELERLKDDSDIPASAFVLLARIYLDEDRWDDARAAVETGMKRQRNDAQEKELRALLRKVEQAVFSEEVVAVLEEAQAAPEDFSKQLKALDLLIEGGHSDKVLALVDVVLRNHEEQQDVVIKRLQNYGQRPEVPFTVLNLLNGLLAKANRYDEALDVVRLMADRAIDKLSTVREASQKILNKVPHHLPTLKLLGDTCREQGRYTEMIHSYSLYLSHGGEESEEIDRALAEAYLSLKDYDNAKRFVRQLLSNGKADVTLLDRTIKAAVDAHNPEDAAEYLKQVEMLDPKHPELAKMKEQVKHGLGERRFAYLKKELEAGKGEPETLEQLGDIAREMSNFNEAITYYQRASRDRQDPNRARRATAKLAHCYMKKRLDDLASETLKEITISLEDDPEEVAIIMDILYDIGNIFLELKHFQKAERIFKQICKIDAGYRDVLQKMESMRG